MPMRGLESIHYLNDLSLSLGEKWTLHVTIMSDPKRSSKEKTLFSISFNEFIYRAVGL